VGLGHKIDLIFDPLIFATEVLVVVGLIMHDQDTDRPRFRSACTLIFGT
jgi:hypothetical protein